MNMRGATDHGVLLLGVAFAIWIGAVPVYLQSAEFVIGFSDIIALATFITAPPTLLILGLWRAVHKDLGKFEQRIAAMEQRPCPLGAHPDAIKCVLERENEAAT